MSRSVVLYLHVHQPYRVRDYSAFDTGVKHDYFDAPFHGSTSNERIMQKVADKSYRPTNKVLQELLDTYPDFKFSLSLSGTVLEQMSRYTPDVLESFQKLVATGRVEILAETYHHSLAFFYSLAEFEAEVEAQRDRIEELFGVKPTAFRNTELSYNNSLALWAERKGYQAIITEGWDPVLAGRTPNHVYQPINTNSIKLLMKNYKLSDDVAFRFSNRDWEEWPLDADKYNAWLNNAEEDPEVINLFMDYETFGEHQWSETGIFDFLRALPQKWLERGGNNFQTITGAAGAYKSKGIIDCPQTITWADSERDLTAWLGNAMQTQAIQFAFSLQSQVLDSKDAALIEDWRRLLASDNFYYMCTKWFRDGDVHAYFSPYESPYEAFMYFMNAMHDIRYRLVQKGAA